MNEEFEKWFEEQLDIGEFLIADKPVALRAWQASRKQALEEAIKEFYAGRGPYEIYEAIRALQKE